MSRSNARPTTSLACITVALVLASFTLTPAAFANGPHDKYKSSKERTQKEGKSSLLKKVLIAPLVAPLVVGAAVAGTVAQAVPNHHRYGNGHWHGGQRYHYYDRGWYRYHNGAYITVTPPMGLWINALPRYHRSYWVDSTQYYYADGVYYQPYNQGYIVINPPQQVIVTNPVQVQPVPARTIQPIQPVQPAPTAPIANAPVPEYQDFIRDIYVYPKGSQTEARTAADKQECAQWAGIQVLARPFAAPATGQEQEAYRRAMSACLDARNYSVR